MGLGLWIIGDTGPVLFSIGLCWGMLGGPPLWGEWGTLKRPS